MKCLLDMDGVICDFMGGLLSVMNCPLLYEDFPNYKGRFLKGSDFGLSETAFWANIGHTFFAQLEWTHDGKEILQVLEDHFGPTNICLLSSPTLDHGSISGKMDWIRREMPGYKRRYLFGPMKEFCASASRLLVDDSDSNIDSFMLEGGTCFHVPRLWNRLYSLVEETNVPECLNKHLTSRLNKHLTNNLS